MQLTLNTPSICSTLDTFEHDFSFATAKMSKCPQTLAQSFITRSIQELKAMVDCLAKNLEISENLPRRNIKFALAQWIAEALLAMVAVEDEWVAEAIAPVEDSPSLEIEVLEPEEKPVYKIVISRNANFTEERVSSLQPYLVDRQGNLFKKCWSPSCDAGYSQLISEHLSNIAIVTRGVEMDGGVKIELMTDDLVVSEVCIKGSPPPFIIGDRGGVYKRIQRTVFTLTQPLQYAQVISERLSNIQVTKNAQVLQQPSITTSDLNT